MSDEQSTTDDGKPADTAPTGDPAQGQQGTDIGKPADGAPAGTEGQGKGDDGADTTDWKARARQHEDRAKKQKSAADLAATGQKAAEDKLAAVLKAAGLTPEDEDPTEAVRKATAERDTAVAEARAVKAERLAERLARKAGADVDALLDSRAVSKALGALDDPTDVDAVQAVIDAVLKDNPRLKAPAAAPPSSPTGDMTGGGDKGSASPDDIDEIRKARRTRRGTD